MLLLRVESWRLYIHCSETRSFGIGGKMCLQFHGSWVFHSTSLRTDFRGTQV